MLYERYRGRGLGYSLRGVGVDLERPDGEDSESSRSFMYTQTYICAELMHALLSLFSRWQHVGGACIDDSWDWPSENLSSGGKELRGISAIGGLMGHAVREE